VQRGDEVSEERDRRGTETRPRGIWIAVYVDLLAALSIADGSGCSLVKTFSWVGRRSMFDRRELDLKAFVIRSNIGVDNLRLREYISHWPRALIVVIMHGRS
jgi:hypothetical protein